MNNSNPTLRKAHKILRKITKKLGNPDLYYSAQIGIDSTKDQNLNTYAAMIAAPREGLAPITIVAFTKDDFFQKLNDFYKNKISTEQLELAYHEAQIESNRRSTEYHEELIDKINNPDPEEPQEAEIIEKTDEQTETQEDKS